MSAKKKQQEREGREKGKVKVGKLQRNRAAVTDLTADEAKKIKGGLIALQHEQTHLAHEHKKGVAGCSAWACTSNHNETLVRDAAPTR